MIYRFAAGFSRVATGLTGGQGQDAAGNNTYDDAPGVNQAAVVLLSADPNGVQIDSIAAGTFSNNGPLIALRIVVIATAGDLTAITRILDNLPQQIGGISVGATPDLDGMVLIPDLTAPQLAAPGGVGAQNGYGGQPNGAVGLLDTLCGVPSNEAGNAAAVIQTSGRPGGGIVVPPGFSCAVIAVPMRFLGGSPVAPVSPPARVDVTVFGGPLAPGQATQASNAGVNAGDIRSLARFTALVVAALPPGSVQP